MDHGAGRLSGSLCGCPEDPHGQSRAWKASPQCSVGVTSGPWNQGCLGGASNQRFLRCMASPEHEDLPLSYQGGRGVWHSSSGLPKS